MLVSKTLIWTTKKNLVFPPPIEIDDDNGLLTHAVKDLELKHALYNPIEKV